MQLDVLAMDGPDAPLSEISLVPHPACPTDLTPAALFLSLANVTGTHVGRKLRMVVQ